MSTEIELQRQCGDLVEREVLCALTGIISRMRELDLEDEEIEALSSQTVWACMDCDAEYVEEDDARSCRCERTHHHEPEERINEAYEWWAVSGWLGRQLASRGELAGELYGCTVWGRCATGQAIKLDPVIREIVLERRLRSEGVA